jgi:hypothetical protein
MKVTVLGPDYREKATSLDLAWNKKEENRIG